MRDKPAQPAVHKGNRFSPCALYAQRFARAGSMRDMPAQPACLAFYRRLVVIAVISDTHLPRGARVLPPRCIQLLADASLVVHAGDFTAASVLAALEAIGPPVVAVHGNMDDGELRSRLPGHAIAGGEGLRIGVVHDGGPRVGRHERLRSWFPGCQAVVYGHSHLPEIAQVGAVWVLNPGSPTERRRAPSHTMIVIRDGWPELVEI